MGGKGEGGRLALTIVVGHDILLYRSGHICMRVYDREMAQLSGDLFVRCVSNIVCVLIVWICT